MKVFMPDRCLPVRQRVSMISSIEGVESVGDAEDAVDATEATEQLDPEVVVNGRAAWSDGTTFNCAAIKREKFLSSSSCSR